MLSISLLSAGEVDNSLEIIPEELVGLICKCTSCEKEEEKRELFSVFFRKGIFHDLQQQRPKINDIVFENGIKTLFSKLESRPFHFEQDPKTKKITLAGCCSLEVCRGNDSVK